MRGKRYLIQEVSSHRHLGWCHWASSHCKHCKCKWLFGTSEKHSDARNWTAQWPSKCGLTSGWTLTPFGEQCFFLMRNSPYRLVANDHMNGPHSLQILHLVNVPCRVQWTTNFAAKWFANEGINPSEILVTSMQTKIMCSNLQISK
jgi:hypothetical protein